MRPAEIEDAIQLAYDMSQAVGRLAGAQRQNEWRDVIRTEEAVETTRGQAWPRYGN